jgi:ubiquinone/menaquinone biosynthesis C-methylase UbiE
MKPVDLNISRDDVLRAFAPAVRTKVIGHSEEWDRGVAAFVKKESSPKPKNVRQTYEKKWSDAASRYDLSAGKDLIVWGDERFIAHSRGTKRVHLLYLMKLIDQTRPKTVLEVGYGTGANLFILAGRFPDIEFSGVELTQSGYDLASAIQSGELPEPIERFSPEPLRDPSAHCRVTLLQGSAENLPFPAKSFDFVYTVQAIEQMESIRSRALCEIARVCAGHVAMVEPFADWNATPERRKTISDRRLFSASVNDLPRYGLRPVFATSDMPTKLNYGIGLVVASPLTA